MKKSILLLLFVATFANAQTSEKDKVNQTIDAWHKAAGDVKFDAYFDLIAEDGIFIGTDATENWTKKDFKVWAKPFFDKSGKIVWFDELLNTQMKICRGSGVLVKVVKEWKIQHYVLSMTIPNDEVDAVTKIKAPIEDVLITKLQKK